MKTISQIAKEIGVSRQAVYKKIKKEPLSTSLQQFTVNKNNIVYIDVEGVKLIKSVFSKNTLSTMSTRTVNQIDIKLPTSDNEVNREVDNLNPTKSVYLENDMSTWLTESLQTQIKNLIDVNNNLTDQNKDLREQLNKEREHSRDQSDKITELAQQMAKLANNAQQLHAGDIMPRLTNDGYTQIDEIQKALEPDQPSQEKKGFFKSIFKRPR